MVWTFCFIAKLRKKYSTKLYRWSWQPTAKWDYFDKNNKLIACVYRYDTEDGKEFRVWDVKTEKPNHLIHDHFTIFQEFFCQKNHSCRRWKIWRFDRLWTHPQQLQCLAQTHQSIKLIGRRWIGRSDHLARQWWSRKRIRTESCRTSSQSSFFRFIDNTTKYKPHNWDAADAVAEGFNINSLFESAKVLSKDSRAILAMNYGMMKVRCRMI